MEFNIIGQDITSYGKDTGADLKDLLKRLASKEGDFYIRLLYMHPKSMDDALVDLILAEEKILDYFDVPVQHSEDSILRSMNRGYTKADLTHIFSSIRKKAPDAVLRTTVMVGFPGESENDFSNLCDFISMWKFDNLGAFMYSKEQGTAAARMKGHLRKGVKRQRFEKIMELQKEISRKRLKRLQGKPAKVIVESKEGGSWTGRLLQQAPDVDGIAFIKGAGKAGEIREGIVTKTLDYDVIVELGGRNGTDQ
jgi:ribosomal protein S12 methylthiotransferase